ncbi:glycosyltransferase [Cellulomonas sp.]|uniref:glycosyltransferase n=1 Tax=Cellulomonas sp. TaxID=40001 RepID=UPI002D4F9357|nr:glycosyltransferase [Cellulomonas sp.]HYQ75315.1 glycosyltransferase [Cellulomonas sp.]
MSARPTVSAVLIVKNEEAVLDDCLASVAWADEVVVYDTGSTDATVEIARRHTHVVVEGYWDDDFGGARNRAMAHATGDWVLVLDADEVVVGDPEQFRANLGRDGVVAHTMVVRNLTDAPDLPLGLAPNETGVAGTRVFRRELHTWIGMLHEQPVLIETGVAAVPQRPASGIEIRHSGYLHAVVTAKDKGRRNVEIARAQVEAARAKGDARELELHRVDLARSLMLNGQNDAAIAEAEELLAEGFGWSRHVVLLARAIYAATRAAGDDEATDRWLDLWEEHDDNPAFALATRAQVLAARGDAAGALAAVERIPTTTVNSFGERLDRSSVITTELWAHARTGDHRRAVLAGLEAIRQGVAPGATAGLVRLLGADGCRRLLAAMPDDLWRQYVTWCAMDTTAEARTFLGWMHDVRPGDPAVLAGAALLAPTLSLEEAAEWSARIRTSGAAAQCPLVLIAADPQADPRQRALAGALAYSAYGDERGLAGLEDALAHVRAEDEAELLAELQIVAPGLVGAAA